MKVTLIHSSSVPTWMLIWQ